MAAFDIDYQRAVLLALLVVLNLALVGAVVTSSTPYGPYNGAWDGGSELRMTAGDDAALTLAHSTAAYTDVRPRETVSFVVAPQSSYSAADRARVRQFVQRGGTLVVATEDNRTNDLLSALDVSTRIDGHLVRDDRENYRGPSLPVATNVVDSNFTDGVDSLTLNYGSVLQVPRSGTETLTGTEAWEGRILVNTSGFAYLDRNRNESLDENETLAERPVAVAEPVGQGKVVVVSDGSVFTNAMLEREGNAQFLRNLAGSRERAVLDYSHGHPLPPLVFALLVVRDLPLLQVGLGLAVLAAIALWMRGVEIPSSILGGDEATEAADVGRLDADELSAMLAAEHPDWDRDRIEDMTKAIIRRRYQSERND
jgi:hypothetical protein